MSERKPTGFATVAELVADAFAANGVRRMFGLPGGGSSLDIIQAAAELGIEFVLTRTESAAVMMAAATADLSGGLGVALTTKGPGVASAACGVAYAALDRSPVLLLTDGFNPAQQAYVTHQAFDQRALLAPVAKAFRRLDGDTVAEDLQYLIDLTMTPPYGPVHVELTGEAARMKPDSGKARWRAGERPEEIDELQLNRAARQLAEAAQPVMIVGLEAREALAAVGVRALAEVLRCPVLTTYKAKGVVSDLHPLFTGIYTGGAVEAPCINQADLILLCGVDPVEFILQPWRYSAPVIDISLQRHTTHYVAPTVGVYGSLGAHLARLAQRATTKTGWTMRQIGELREQAQAQLQYREQSGMGPQRIVEMAADAGRLLPAMPRIAVDAGAHMFSAMAFWPCAAPHDVLISNGLATMAFALPAAIAASLLEPERPVIVFTGDGGLLMCLGELLTAVEQRARIVVIVFNDGSLSLIDIKQQQRGLPSRGVRWSQPDFADVMGGLGGRGFKARTVDEYRRALGEALRRDGPSLIDVSLDPGGYPQQLKAMRG